MADWLVGLKDGGREYIFYDGVWQGSTLIYKSYTALTPSLKDDRVNFDDNGRRMSVISMEFYRRIED